MPLSITRCVITLGVAAGAFSVVLAGCEMAHKDSAATSTAPASAPAPWWAKTEASEKGGAELWAETCSRCHNLRSPSSYGPAQWEVAVYDMRVRANLTGEEQRKILEFLKAASQ